ncbi:POK11 protein, partial [Chaetorhynchus papuensis]|nr:POK11 protein [Chaetorhynchus papuensis]
GFELQAEKVQRTSPWKHLGLKITETSIVPQAIKINDNPRTLQELHQLCGSLNWVRPWLGLTSKDLAPLFNLLTGGGDFTLPRSLTAEARQAIWKAEEAIGSRQANRYLPHLPFQLIVLDEGRKDSLIIIKWAFLPHQPSKTITTPQELMASLVIKGRARLRTLVGCDFTCIYLPIISDQLEHLIQTNQNLQFALDSYSGQISSHRPKHKLFNEAFYIIPREVQSRKPIKDALTLFTDGSGRSHRSVITWKDLKTWKWESDVEVVQGSPQVAELSAVVRAFERFPEPFNLVTDSAYVAGVVMRAEGVLLKEVSNERIYNSLSKLVKLISHREQPFYVMHVRSHTDLPGEVAEGNQRADILASPAELAKLPLVFEQAKISHAMFHQNVPALVRMFHLTRDQAKAIVATCPSCQTYQLPSLGSGVNKRGINSGEVWQMDVTHFPEFGWLKYVHVSIDTFSGAVFASTHAGEK